MTIANKQVEQTAYILAVAGFLLLSIAIAISTFSALNRRCSPARVCQAWHVASGVRVPVPGFRGAEG